ncbi:hypothetical protein HBI70_017530 [Parastagonospora nodorum]|nr:hypothetical protein HBI70_017530 [Parastagonospora nodorum]
MSQTNVREGYRITTLEVIKLIEDLISYLTVAKCIQLQNAQIPKVFYKAAYSAKVKTKDLSNTLMLTLSKTAQRQSSSIISNRSTALITNKFSVALLTKPAILNNANIALVDAMHHSIIKQFSIFRLITKKSQQKLEKNYFKVINALTITLIKNDDNLLGTVNSYIKLRRLRARRKTKAADSRHAKASRERTKKDKDSEDSNTSSNRLGKKAQLKKTRDEEELAKLDSLLDSNDYRLDSSLDINSKDNLEDEELTDAYILYFKELSSNNSRIFANAISIGKTQAIVLTTEVQNAQVESNATEYNAVNNDNKLCPTKGERTFYCACKRSPSFNAEPQQAAIIITTLQFCFFSDSPLENIGRLTKEKAIEMQINTTNAISKALAAANKLVALQSYVLEGATKHRLALLAAQFIIVYSFRKIDKHVFRAYNTISVTAQRTIIRKGGSYIEKRAILLSNFLSIVQNAKQQCRDILEKEGLNKSEASRRVIFNRFKIQAIASYSALATLKAAQFKTYSSCKVKRFTLNSVKDLFTNLSKNYFLVREARAITKSSLNIAVEDAAKAANTLLPPKEVCAKILIESYKLIVQAIIVALIAFAEAIILTEATHVVIIEPQDSIVYFNPDSKLELKVLGKQDVKTTF